EGVPEATDMIRQAVDGHEVIIRGAREMFDVAEKAGDQATADMLTERLEVHEKAAWMLRVLLQEALALTLTRSPHGERGPDSPLPVRPEPVEGRIRQGSPQTGSTPPPARAAGGRARRSRG